MRDHERDALRKCVLELLQKGSSHYTWIEKKTIATCKPFMTVNTFRKQFYDYLLPHGYVKRQSRGVYAITDKGRKLLDILS